MERTTQDTQSQNDNFLSVAKRLKMASASFRTDSSVGARRKLGTISSMNFSAMRYPDLRRRSVTVSLRISQVVTKADLCCWAAFNQRRAGE